MSLCENLFGGPPQFPPSKKGEEYSKTLEWLMLGHGVIAVVKIILGGFGAGMGDCFSMLILWCGYSKFDYC